MKKLKTTISLLRVKHWLKNLLLFAPPFFGGLIFDLETLSISFQVFISFSLLSSAGYIFNDLRDRQADSFHPQKRNRPLVQGEISVNSAIYILSLCIFLSLFLGIKVGHSFLFFLFVYFVLNIIYTLYLKPLPIFELFGVVFGFIIRVLAGGNAFQIEVSNWLFLTVFFVSLLLSTGKRLEELVSLKNNACLQRSVLKEYPSGFLEAILYISATISLLSYSIYTLEKGKDIFYTVPLVTFGLFRYIFMVKKEKGEPIQLLLEDKILGSIFLLWIIMVGILRYS